MGSSLCGKVREHALCNIDSEIQTWQVLHTIRYTVERHECTLIWLSSHTPEGRSSICLAQAHSLFAATYWQPKRNHKRQCCSFIISNMVAMCKFHCLHYLHALLSVSPPLSGLSWYLYLKYVQSTIGRVSLYTLWLYGSHW